MLGTGPVEQKAGSVECAQHTEQIHFYDTSELKIILHLRALGSVIDTPEKIGTRFY